MKSTQFIFALFLSITAMVGCNGDNATGPGDQTIEDLQGTWRATKFEFIYKDSASQKVDLVPLGATYTLIIGAQGEVTTTFIAPGDQPETETGTASIDEDGKLFLDFDGTDDDVTAEYELSGMALTLTIDGAEYDFDNDGTDDPATVTLALQKQTIGVRY